MRGWRLYVEGDNTAFEFASEFKHFATYLKDLDEEQDVIILT